MNNSSKVLTFFLTMATFMAACFAHDNPTNGTLASWPDDDSKELELTWLKGALMLPKDLSDQLGIPVGQITRIDRVVEKLPSLKLQEPAPLAILVHGCFGIGGEQVEQAKILVERGFVAFMPSYYGRTKAIQICGGNAAGEIQFDRINEQRVKQRLDEVDYALFKARKLPFVNTNKTLISGHSMGGITIGKMKRTDVTAYVITGWGCGPQYSGRPPKQVPLLAIRFRDDPWLNSPHQCDAGLFTGRDKENTISLVLEGQRTHEVVHDPRAVATYLEFIGRIFEPLDNGSPK